MYAFTCIVCIYVCIITIIIIIIIIITVIIIIYYYSFMLIPIRCFTCGKVIGNLWEKYEKMVNDMDHHHNKNNMHTIFQKLGVRRYCCKRMLLTHVDFMDELLAR